MTRKSDRAPPSSSSFSVAPLAPRDPSIFERFGNFLVHVGAITRLSVRATKSLWRRPFETHSTVYQMEMIGVRSLSIVAVTSVFIGMVMTIQFAYGLRRFGGIEYIPRVIVLAFLRELSPTLTAIIVGGRVGSGMAAEVGAMAVTEQVDAIRALGADPAKKLVLPRVLAATLVMPVLSLIALLLGIVGSMFVCAFEYQLSPGFFLRSSLEVVFMRDLVAGIMKPPVFGFLIAIIGCYFGITTRGGTEGVGTSTTRTVVAVSIAILVADLLMTKVLMMVFPPG